MSSTSEASVKPSQKPYGEPRRNTFEGVDLREAGRKGGYASGISRRLRNQRELEAKVLASGNGAAAVKLLEIKRADQAELLERQLEADRHYVQLCEWADQERERLDELQLVTAQRTSEIAALEQRRQQLDSDDAIDALLLAIGEERATRSAYRIGWAVDEDAD